MDPAGAVATFNWHGRPGFIPQGSFARAVAGVMTGGTFTPFPEKVQAPYFDRQATW